MTAVTTLEQGLLDPELAGPELADLRPSRSAHARQMTHGAQRPVQAYGEERLGQVLPFPGLTEPAVKSSPPALAGSQVPPLWLRMAVWVAAMSVAFTAAILGGLALRPAPYQGPTWVHSVAGGESLWGLAEAIGSDRPLEDVVEDIRTLNGLQDNVVYAGDDLLLPMR